ncbi:hypothetical protein [Streptomyces sp. NPDC050759]|uniref:hypothetical protein n=1 Tax=Streptomyces sp. NPDC050759 TaxID=3365635 RepID=UPI003791181A
MAARHTVITRIATPVAATMERVATLCASEAGIPAGVSPKMPMLSGDTDDMPGPSPAESVQRSSPRPVPLLPPRPLEDLLNAATKPAKHIR